MSDQLNQSPSERDSNQRKHFRFFSEPISNKPEPELVMPVSTGTQLAKAREKLKLSRADVSKIIRLSEDLIDAIEKCHYDKLFARAYATGYVRAYASVVQLNANELIKNDPELGVDAIPNSRSNDFNSSGKKRSYYRTTWSTIAARGITIVFVVILVVTGWNFRDEFQVWWDNQNQAETILDIQEAPTDSQRINTPTESGGIDSNQTPS